MLVGLGRVNLAEESIHPQHGVDGVPRLVRIRVRVRARVRATATATATARATARARVRG